MTSVPPLAADALCRHCDAQSLPFTTTDELPDLLEFIGQERASQAVELGVRMRHPGYNIFAFGAPGTGKLTLVRQHIEQRAAAEPVPADWCYVNNFETPARPQALRLPAGIGKQLRADMQHFTDELRTGLSSAFESEEVQARRQRLAEEFQERQSASLNELNEKARVHDLALIRTPAGLAFAPLKEGNVLPPEEFEKLPEDRQQEIKQQVDGLQDELQKVLFKMPGWERELRKRMRDLNQEITSFVLASILDDLLERFKEFPTVLAWLDTVQKDVIEHVLDLLSAERPSDSENASPMQGFLDGKASPRRYQVNLLVDASESTGAPVYYESNPTYANLVGRVEHMTQMGALTTDFMLIKPGALHRVNGGYLILDAQRVVASPYSWEGLKRALQFHQIRIESPLEQMGLMQTITLEPEPIPLDVKVVFLGEPMIYYLLSAYDPDFNELFKVSADFDDEIDRTPESELLYARLLATIARREHLRPFHATAVARLIEQSARATEDSERLTARIADIKGLMLEADHWAERAGAAVVEGAHVRQAVDSRVYRLNRVEQRMREAVLRGTLLIDTEGSRAGTINALSVVQMGKYNFGHPSRITVSVRLGGGEVIDIEREVEMGGPIHSKGVMILTSFLRTRFSPEEPLALAASITLRAELWRRRRRQRLVDRALRPALGDVRAADQAGHRRHRLGQPVGPGAGHRRRQREDRGVFRSLRRARSDGRPGRGDPGVERAASHAAPRRRRGGTGREVQHLSRDDNRRGDRGPDGASSRRAPARRRLSRRNSLPGCCGPAEATDRGAQARRGRRQPRRGGEAAGPQDARAPQAVRTETEPGARSHARPSA